MDLKNSIITILIYFCLLFSSGCNFEKISENNIISQKVDSLIEVQKISDNCILVKFGFDAITAINTRKGIVIIDAGISSWLTGKYRKIIENEFQSSDFNYVINTHGHHDHYRGNSIFSESKVVGHVNCLQEISDYWNNPDKVINGLSETVEDLELQLKSAVPNSNDWCDIFTQKIRYLTAYYDARNLIPIKQPDITFSDSMKLDLGDITLEMIYFGKCHSNSDILIFVPGISTLFIGDLFFKYGRPSINNTFMTDKARWKQSIRWIEKRLNNIKVIISGHGEILSIEDLKNFNSNILIKCSEN